MSGPRRALSAAVLTLTLWTSAPPVFAAGLHLADPVRRAVATLPALVTASQPAPGSGVPGEAEFVGLHVWRMSDPDFGGFSGIELSADGTRYTALSDRGTLRWGTVERDGQGRIRALTMAGQERLRDSRARPLRPGYMGDSEGIAIDAEGRIFVSFEGLDRIVRYDSPDAPAKPLTRGAWFARLRHNFGMEALALSPSGDVLTIPEDWPAESGRLPLWRLRDGVWSRIATITHDGRWAPVGADVGPDGRLYLLERDFKGILGFASRVRRFDLPDPGVAPDPETAATAEAVPGEVLLTSTFRQFDNLEGLSVWHDGTGIRLTMISDDNFLLVQRTELVEYRIPDAR